MHSFSTLLRFIWRSGKRADLLLDNPRFRAGYDFLLLREHAGEDTGGLGDWWTDYQDASDSQRRQMIRDLAGKPEAAGSAPRKRRRSSGRRKRDDAGGAGEE